MFIGRYAQDVNTKENKDRKKLIKIAKRNLRGFRCEIESSATTSEVETMHRSYAAFALLFTSVLSAQQRTASQEKAIAARTIDPTWLYRDANSVPEKPSDITTPTCHYKPMFGVGDAQTSVVVGVARFGEVVLDPGGSCA